MSWPHLILFVATVSAAHIPFAARSGGRSSRSSDSFIVPLSRRAISAPNVSAGVVRNDFGTLSTNVSFGGQSVSVEVNTGSSDSWVLDKGWQCVTMDQLIDSSFVTCAERRGNGYNSTQSATSKATPSLAFNTTYINRPFFFENSSGAIATSFPNIVGAFSNDSMSVAGMTVQTQAFGVVSNVTGPFWPRVSGDPGDVGSLGLGHPGSNSGHTPFFSNAVNRGSFSIAVNRSVFQFLYSSTPGQGGYLVFGGMPPVPLTNKFVDLPVQAKAGEPSYQVDVTYSFPGSDKLSSGSTTTRASVDTSAPLIFVPSDVATAFHAAFNPPATADPVTGIYHVFCNATIPPFQITLGGTSFTLDPRDVLVPVADLGQCQSTITAQRPSEIGRLGIPFFFGTVVTFNPFDMKLTVTERANYSNTALDHHSPRSAAAGRGLSSSTLITALVMAACAAIFT